MDIAKFKVEGEIFLWKYKKKPNYPGWNLTANAIGKESLIVLLTTMLNSEWSVKKNIALALPTEKQTDIPTRSCQWSTKSNLILNYKKNVENNYWAISENENTLEIIFDHNKLIEFINSIKKLSKGINDFAISDFDAENILYFW